MSRTTLQNPDIKKAHVVFCGAERYTMQRGAEAISLTTQSSPSRAYARARLLAPRRGALSCVRVQQIR